MSEARELSGYRVVRRIAVGGMAEIFEARAEDGSRVVLKVLLPQYAKDAEIVRMLEHEGRIMQRLAHPRLVRVLDVHAAGAEPFLVLEHVDGVAASDLGESMRALGERASPAMALVLVLAVLEALEHVHGARDEDGRALGVVHRDVTPHNVLVTREGDVCLGDFGIARSSLRDARTRTGIIRGKLRYLAPEQATGSSIDARTDLYGVGLLLWELLVGAPYLDAASEIELLRAAESPTFRLTSELAGVDPRFDRVLERMLGRFPEERFADASAVRRGLEPIARELDLEAAKTAWGRAVSLCMAPRDASAERERPLPVLASDDAAALDAPAGSPARARADRGRRSARAAWLVAAGTLTIVGALALLWTGEPAAPSGSPLHRPADPPREGAARASVTTAGGAPTITPAREEPASSETELAPLPPTAGPAHPRSSLRAPRRDQPARPAPEPAEHGQEAASSTSDVGLARARERLRDVRASLHARGILDTDLSRAQRERVRAAGAALDRGDAREAELDAVATELAALSVDEGFVRGKLERVDRRIRAARARGMDTTHIERLSALALQDLLEGRHDATNRRLNEILAQLD